MQGMLRTWPTCLPAPETCVSAELAGCTTMVPCSLLCSAPSASGPAQRRHGHHTHTAAQRCRCHRPLLYTIVTPCRTAYLWPMPPPPPAAARTAVRCPSGVTAPGGRAPPLQATRLQRQQAHGPARVIRPVPAMGHCPVLTLLTVGTLGTRGPPGPCGNYSVPHEAP